MVRERSKGWLRRYNPLHSLWYGFDNTGLTEADLITLFTMSLYLPHGVACEYWISRTSNTVEIKSLRRAKQRRWHISHRVLRNKGNASSKDEVDFYLTVNWKLVSDAGDGQLNSASSLGVIAATQVWHRFLASFMHVHITCCPSASWGWVV